MLAYAPQSELFSNSAGLKNMQQITAQAQDLDLQLLLIQAKSIHNSNRDIPRPALLALARASLIVRMLREAPVRLSRRTLQLPSSLLKEYGLTNQMVQSANKEGRTGLKVIAKRLKELAQADLQDALQGLQHCASLRPLYLSGVSNSSLTRKK